MIRNYIFDFGNVLAEFDPDKLTAPFVKDAEIRKMLSEIVFDRVYWDRLDDGSITDGEIYAGIKGRVSSKDYDLACSVYRNWVKSLSPVPGMVSLVSDIKKTDKKLYLLSNISIGFANSYREVSWIKDLLSFFDGLVFQVLSGWSSLTKRFMSICSKLLI